MAVVDLHHSRRPVESKTAQKTVNKPGQHRHLTRFLSRDLPQHKHADGARNLANLLARNCILSPPLARHPLTTCACVCVVVRLGHFCNPLAFPPSRALSFSLSALFCSPFANRFAFFFFVFSFTFIFATKTKTLHTVRNVAAVKNSRKNTSLPTTTTAISYSQSADNAPPPHYTRLGEVFCCVKAPRTNQPHSLTH